MRRTSRRRRSSGRFFLTALVIAVAIFAVVELIQHWRHPSPRASNTAPSSVTSAIAAASDNLKGFQVFLKRGGCNGACPYYALMYKAGTLKYVGVRGVAKQGSVTEPFSKDEQKQLLQEVESAAFFNFRDSYGLTDPGCRALRTDAPTFTVGVTLNGQTKIVAANEACSNVPLQLRRLARGIDEATHSAQWTGVVQAPVASTGT